ncbi:MAG: murein biosynthesis integral membrane protein MurJ [Gammaproteobacteria bacterium]
MDKRKRSNMAGHAVTVGGMTLISRVLGLLRDIVLARFGVGPAMDAFFVAFKIPNFMRRLFAEGAFSQAFVPVLTEYKTTGSQAEVRALVDRVAGTFIGVLGLITLVGVLASPLLVLIFAPGFLQEPLKYDLTAHMLRFTFPYLMFMSLVAFAAGILNSYGKFGAAAFAPVWLNVILIGMALLVCPQLEEPMLGLAWGVLLAGFVQLAFLLPSLRSLGLLPRPRWGWHDSGVRKVMRLMIPGIIGSSVAQINLLFDTLLASFLLTGSVSWLYFADRLVEFPLGIFAIALATVILPLLSQRHAEGDTAAFSRTLDAGLRWVLLIGLPAMTGLMLLAQPAITTLFQYDGFAAQDVRMAGLALLAYAAGLPGFMLVKILAPAFYSRQDTKTPVRIAIRSMIANMILNVLFVVPMLQLGMSGAHAGLALATSIASFLNAFWLYRHLRADKVYLPAMGWGKLLLQIVFATSIMALVLFIGVPGLSDWLQMSGVTRVSTLGFWVLAGVGSYLLALRLSGLQLSVFIRPSQ